jgi:hypothetical protein
LSVVTHIDPKYGGLSAAVPALADAVSQAGRYSTSIAGFCAAGEYFKPVTANAIPIDHMPLGRLHRIKDSASRKIFGELVNRSAGVHIHDIWEHGAAAAASRARSAKKKSRISFPLTACWSAGH